MVELMSLIKSTHNVNYQRQPAELVRWRRLNFNGRDCLEAEIYGMPGIDDGTFVRTPSILHIEEDCTIPYVVTVLTWFRLGQQLGKVEMART